MNLFHYLFIPEHLNYPNENEIQISKSATMTIPHRMSQADKYPITSQRIHRSITDYDVQYPKDDIGPPPSPTPAHSRMEERFTSHYYSSLNPTSSNFSSYQSSDPSSYPSTVVDSKYSSLPAYAQPGQSLYPRPTYRRSFRPVAPRGFLDNVNGKGKPQKREGIQSTCLRESSV